MSVLDLARAWRTDAKESIHHGADHQGAPDVGCRGKAERVGAPTRDHGDDAVSLEEEVRRDAGERCAATQSARGREPPAQANRCGPGAESAGREGPAGKKVVTAEQRRTAVILAMETAGITQ